VVGAFYGPLRDDFLLDIEELHEIEGVLLGIGADALDAFLALGS